MRCVARRGLGWGAGSRAARVKGARARVKVARARVRVPGQGLSRAVTRAVMGTGTLTELLDRYNRRA